MHAHASAGVHVEIEGVRLPVHMRGDEAYVGLGAFAAARFLEYEYSYVTNTYLLRNPQDDGSISILEFRPDDPLVQVDDSERTLRSPPVEGKDGLLVPLHDFAVLVLGPRRAAAIQVRPDEGDAARLIQVTPLVRKGVTKLLFEWEGEPQPRLERHPERAEVEVVFEGAMLGRQLGELTVTSEEMTSVHLSQDPDLLQVRAVVHLRGPTSSEGFFLASSHQYVLTLRTDQSAGGDTYALPASVSEEERRFLAQQLVGINASHGGGDTGSQAGEERSEKALVLAFAQDLQDLCERTGLRIEMVRNDDRLVPMHARVHALNRARCSLVLSLHARSQQGSQASTAPALFLLPVLDEAPPSAPPATSPSPLTSGPLAPDALVPPGSPEPPDLETLRAPRPGERAEAEVLASFLARSLTARLGLPVRQLQDPSLLPLARVLAPGLSVDLGPLTSFAGPGDPAFERDPLRRRLAFACYQGLLDYFRDLRARYLEASLAAPEAAEPGSLPEGEIPGSGSPAWPLDPGAPPGATSPPTATRAPSPAELRGLHENILNSPEYPETTPGGSP